MASYSTVSASGNARQHNGDQHGDIYNNNNSTNNYNNSTNSYNIQNQLGQPNPFTQLLSTQGQQTALHKACAKGDESLVHSILQGTTADLEAQNDDWMTPLQVAVHKNHPGIAKILLDFGANIEARCNMWAKSQRPIFLAVLNGNEEMVRLLVESCAEIEEGNAIGLTPLGVAAKEGFAGIAAYLASKGAKLEKSDSTVKYTPLGWAVHGGHAEVVAVLLQYGAATNGKNMRGRSILELAKRNPQIAQMLESRGASTTSPYGGGQVTLGLTPHTPSPWGPTISNLSSPNLSSRNQSTTSQLPQPVNPHEPISNLSTSNSAVASNLQHGQYMRDASYPASLNNSFYPPQSNISQSHINGPCTTGGYQHYPPSQQHTGYMQPGFGAARWGQNSNEMMSASKRSKGRNFFEKLVDFAVRVL